MSDGNNNSKELSKLQVGELYVLEFLPTVGNNTYIDFFNYVLTHFVKSYTPEDGYVELETNTIVKGAYRFNRNKPETGLYLGCYKSSFGSLSCELFLMGQNKIIAISTYKVNNSFLIKSLSI